ncbi:hypothetical protein [Egbenema bharatensis]|uniref:hypothetical protein n=1 Tax=Egbenema bharatensis TaxID=3463334 RepID=UPI003A89EBA2
MDAKTNRGSPRTPRESLRTPRESTRTAKDIIDQAIRENRFGERLLYLFAIVFLITGLLLMGVAVANQNPISAILGAVSSVLFAPAMDLARRTRRENMSIRLLEVALNQADTSREAAEALRTVFVETFTSRTNARNKKLP